MKIETDVTLAELQQRATQAQSLAGELFELISDAKQRGYTFDELVRATGIPRGSIQRICNGTQKYLPVPQD